MNRAAESLYLLDMGDCTPSTAIGEEFARGQWTTVEYSIAAGNGRMLFSGPGNQAPPLRLLLPIRGWHHILIGTYRNP